MGPLNGMKVVEFAGIGPGPFCCMLLADMGADILRVDRPQSVGVPDEAPEFNTTLRGRPNAAIDLKHAAGRDAALKLCAQADVLIEGFRPGVMERLSLGPVDVWSRNPKLVYGRMTGWGQDGPIAHTAGHDINYIALSGALHAIGTRDGGPIPPLNLVGDYGGGALYLAMGVLAAYIEAQKSGKGQVVDAAMIEGAASLMTPFYGWSAAAGAGHNAHNAWREERGTNYLDGGAHFYNVYETADGEHICVGAIEPQFYARLLEMIGVSETELAPQKDRARWSDNREKLAAVFKLRNRDAWTDLLQAEDVCYAPVLSMQEAPDHPQFVDRKAFVDRSGVKQPGPAPRFSRTSSEAGAPPEYAGQSTRDALSRWGLADPDIESLIQTGAVRQRT